MNKQIRYILLFSLYLFTFNSYAQLGELFRRIGNAIDSVTQQNGINTNKSESAINNNSISADINANPEKTSENIASKNIVETNNPYHEFLIGRWVDPKDKFDCPRLDSNFGNHVSKNDSSTLGIITITKDNKVTSETIIESVAFSLGKSDRGLMEEKIYTLKGRRNLIQDNRIVTYEAKWQDVGGNYMRVVDLKVDNRHIVIEGDFRAEKVIYYKCEKTKPVNLTYSREEMIKKGIFGIKGLYLGQPVPAEYKKGCATVQRINANVGFCYVKLTVMGIDSIARVTFYNDVISSVEITDGITQMEFDSKNLIENDNLLMGKRFGKLSIIKDFPDFTNDVILNIIESTGDLNNRPTSQSEDIDALLGLSNYKLRMRGFKQEKDLNRSELNKYRQNLDILHSKLNSQCNQCKSTFYKFKWNLNSTEIEFNTTVPKSKDDPFPFYSFTIVYHDTALIREFSKNAEEIGEENKRKEIEKENERLQKIKEFEGKRNELRKKDF